MLSDLQEEGIRKTVRQSFDGPVNRSSAVFL